MKYIIAFLVEKIGAIALIVAGSLLMSAAVTKSIPDFVAESPAMLGIWAWTGPILASIIIVAGLSILLRNQLRVFVGRLVRGEI